MSYNNIKQFINECKMPYNYNMEEEYYIKNVNNMNVFERFFWYQASNSNRKNSLYDSGRKLAQEIQKEYSDYMEFDCDGSGGKRGGIRQGNICMLSRNIYRNLWCWRDIDPMHFDNTQYFIKNTERYGFCRLDELGLMGPDTMNSANTLLNDIIKEIVSKPYMKMLKDIKKGNFSINYTLELYANKVSKDLLISELESVPYLAEYLTEYHKMGNFILVPAYFNSFRASKVDDYWIESLLLLKNKEKNDKWVCRNNEIQWDSENFTLYINYFFLWDYFDDYQKLHDYKILKKQNVSDYMKKMVSHMKRRGIFMTLMLEINLMIGSEKYNELMMEIFAKRDRLYQNYDEVFDMLGKYFVKVNNWSLYEKINIFRGYINLIPC